jgi:transposase
MNRGVTLTDKDQKMLAVLTKLDAHRLTGLEAARLLGLSLRQVRRLVAAYRLERLAAVVHGNCGRQSPLKTPAEICERIINLARDQYADYNDTHFAEKLGELHDIKVSRSTVRRLRRSIGQSSPRKRRAPRHRSRHQRYPQPGMLLQLDGSDHDWLEGRGPHIVLIAAIDDAASEVPWAFFRLAEDAAGYFELLWMISETHGLPLAVYTDRHTIDGHHL